MTLLWKIYIVICFILISTGVASGQSEMIPADTTKAKVLFPLKTSINGRYLVDQKNKPFPILGRTAWFIISQPASGYQLFIDNSLAKGYNAIEMHVLNHDHRGYHAPFNGNGDLPFLKQLNSSDWNGSLNYSNINKEAPDLATPNENYWKYVDTFLTYCESKGILVFFFPAYLGYVGSDQGWMEELIANGTEKSEAYGAWIANRYKNQKNLVWLLLGDMGYFTISQRNAEAALIKGLLRVPDQQSIHYSAEANSGQNSADQKDFGDQMTLNGTYTWGSVTVPSLGRKAYAHQPVLPAFLLEEPYDEEGPDGNKVNPNAIQPVRRFQWWGWLSTIGGYISGNGYVWPFVDWQKYLETQGSSDMKRLNSFITSITWWDLIPSGLTGMRKLIKVCGGIESDVNYVSAAATSSGSLLVAYIPPAHRGSITVDLTTMNHYLSASWFDPTHGAYIRIQPSPFLNKGTHTFTPPLKNYKGDQDWALVITTNTKTGNDSAIPKKLIK